LPNGKLSCFGDEIALSLTAMAENGGIFDGNMVCKRILKHFGDPASPYQVTRLL
jgi:hypothetical protein